MPDEEVAGVDPDALCDAAELVRTALTPNAELPALVMPTLSSGEATEALGLLVAKYNAVTGALGANAELIARAAIVGAFDAVLVDVIDTRIASEDGD